MSYVKLPFLPGVYKDDSPGAAESHWIDADKVRFVRDKPQTFGGWEKFATSAVTGIARGAHAWADNSTNKYVAVGTHLRLYAYNVDGLKYDITPVTARGNLSAPFDTTISSTTVTVNWTAHGLVENQKVKFYNATAGGGITVDGEYTVNASPATDSFTITHSVAATSTATGTGGTNVDYDVFLAPGLQDGLGGLGYGTGGYGSGTYGGSSTDTTLYPRTWSLDNWGQNLLANPRGGAIYEWAPNTAATELVTNGGFSVNNGWTVGTGWSTTASNAVGSVATGDLTQTITLARGAWHLLKYNVTITAGSVYACVAGVTINTSTASQRSKTVFWSGAGGSAVLKFTGGGFTGTLDDVSVVALATAHKIPASPASVLGIFVTPERRLAYLGGPNSDYNTDPLRVGWTAAQDNQTFTTSATNGAGSFPLSQGTRCMTARVASGENVIATDTALYSMRYTFDATIPYTFDLIATGCGVIGPMAMTILNGRLHWMTSAGEFMYYDGGRPSDIPSTIDRDVLDNLAAVQQDKICAFPMEAFGEVSWLYPDSRDGNECSRYALMNSQNQWANGTFARTSWIDRGVFPYPIAVDTSGFLWYHEKGNSEDGAARTWSIESAYFDIADGNNHQSVTGVYPDDEDLVGGYSLTVYSRHRNVQGITDRTYGPFSVTAAKGKVPMRVVGQQVKFKWSGNAAPTWWRLGAPSFDVVPTRRVR